LVIRLLLETAATTERARTRRWRCKRTCRSAPDAHTWLAEAFLAEGQLDHAEQALRAALAADPNAIRAEIC